MNPPRTITLDDAATIGALRRLHATQRGSREFYEQAAKRAPKDPLHSLFKDAARQRGRHAAELADHIPALNTGGDQAVTLGDRLRGAWMTLRGLVNLGNHYVLLVEAERAEDRVKLAYQGLLGTSAGLAVEPMLTRQCEELEVIHHRIRKQRDHAKARR